MRQAWGRSRPRLEREKAERRSSAEGRRTSAGGRQRAPVKTFPGPWPGDCVEIHAPNADSGRRGRAETSGHSLHAWWRGEGRIGATRAESQWIVAARPLCHLQYPVAYLSRLQRILLAARWELRFRASRSARPPSGERPRHVPSGSNPTAGRQSGGGRVRHSGPDSDLEAFSHNPTHGSFAPLAFQPSAMTNCANQRFLSY